MKYTDLTLDQRISLKGLFFTDKDLVNYKAIFLLWNFILAVEYFLNDDINVLYRATFDFEYLDSFSNDSNAGLMLPIIYQLSNWTT